MAGFGPASLPHLALVLDSVAPGGSAKAPAPLPSLGLVMYDAGIFGTLTKTLDAVTSASAGKVSVSGTLGKTLSTITLASLGNGGGAGGSVGAAYSLPHMAFLFESIAGIVGQTNKTLEALTSISEGDVPGNEIWTYEYEDKPPRTPLYWPHARNIDWFGTSTVLRANFGGAFGVVGQTLQPLTVVSLGRPVAGGTLAKTLDALTRSSTGVVVVSGTVSKTLSALTVSGSSFVVGGFVGTLYKVLDSLTLSSGSTGNIACSVNKTLDALTCVSAGVGSVSGTLAKTLQNINANIDGTVLSGYVAVVNNFLQPLTCSARIGSLEFVVHAPSGGWLRKRKKQWYEELPTPEEVEAERTALGILPKKAQKVVKETVRAATDSVNEKQAALLAAAYLEEAQQRSLVDRLRSKADKTKTKWTDDMFTVTRALILDELRKKADSDELERLLIQQEHEEVEANEILALWMEEL
jgi:hypothetical protein